MPAGRPASFSDGMAEDICHLIASEVDSMAEVADKLEIGQSTIWRWISKYPKFRDDYLSAKEVQATRLADEAIKIARDGLKAEEAVEVASRRLMIDTIRWKAKTLVPGIYGERKELKVSGMSHEQALDLLDENDN